ncbi:helix-turn-helix domain-containing protein [Shewanella algae]|uniref:helix-turn-helix domain-containing protein n=1 Tax=Shewanella algae TaxID=38313 RepID=UPI0031F55788
MSMELMVKAMRAKVGNPLRKLVLLKLADNANDHGECWPSYQHVADQCEISHSSVRNHIAALDKAGYLSITPRKNELGHQSNLYRLQFPPKPKVEHAEHGMQQPVPADDIPMPADSTGVCQQMAEGMPAGDIPPMPADDTRTSHSFEPVNEPIKNKRAKRSKSAVTQFDFSKWPGVPSQQVFDDWIVVRQSKRAKLTQTAVNRLGKELHEAAKHGFSVDDCLGYCVVRGWVGFEFRWLQNSGLVGGGGVANVPEHSGVPAMDDFDHWGGNGE